MTSLHQGGVVMSSQITHTQLPHKTPQQYNTIIVFHHFFYKLNTFVLFIEVYLWNKFLGNASTELAAFKLINF